MRQFCGILMIIAVGCAYLLLGWIGSKVMDCWPD